jgi:hypothetical protein
LAVRLAGGAATLCRAALVVLLAVATTSQSVAAFLPHDACRYDASPEMAVEADPAASASGHGSAPCHEVGTSADASALPVDAGCNGDCGCPTGAAFCPVTVTIMPALRALDGAIPFSLNRIETLAPDRRWRPPAA